MPPIKYTITKTANTTASSGNIRFFQGTNTVRAESIATHGFDTQVARKYASGEPTDSIWATDCIWEAAQFAKLNANVPDEGQPVIIGWEIPMEIYTDFLGKSPAPWVEYYLYPGFRHYQFFEPSLAVLNAQLTEFEWTFVT
jgi:hypothetical protein